MVFPKLKEAVITRSKWQMAQNVPTEKALYFNINRTVAEVYFTDSGWSRPGQVEVQRGEAELDFNLTWTTSAGVARGSPPPTPLKSTKAKSRYNEAKPSCTWTWPRWTWAEVVRGGHHRLHSSPPRPSSGTTRRSRVVPGLCCGGLELKLHEEESKYTEAQPRCTCFPPSATSVQCWWGGRQVHRGAAEVYLSFLRINIALESDVHRVQLQSIVDEEEASTTRRSRVVLVLLPNQQCWGVGGGLPSATPAQCWRGGRQVHRGEAEVYLPSLRVNIAPESVKYTPATVRF